MGLTSLVALSCASDKSGSLDGPVTGDTTLSGQVINYDGSPVAGVEIDITGDGVLLTAVTDSTGAFSAFGLEPGSYVVTPIHEYLQFAPGYREVTVLDEDVSLDTFVLALNYIQRFFIRGRITDGDGKPVGGVMVFLSSESYGRRLYTLGDGTFTYPVYPGETYTLTPEKPGYAFTFDPPQQEFSITVESEHETVRDFVATYDGPALYTITGSMVDKLGEATPNGAYLYDGSSVHRVMADDEGTYRFEGMNPGVYKIVYNDIGYYEFEPGSMTVEVIDSDIVLPPVTGTYIGPTTHTITGQIVDQRGGPVPGVSLAVYTMFGEHDPRHHYGIALTDDRGAFSHEVTISHYLNNLEYVIKPLDDSHLFNPDSTMVHLWWERDTKHAGVTALEPVTAVDVSDLDAGLYFPMHDGAVWRYRRESDGSDPVEHEVAAGNTMIVDGLLYRDFTGETPWRIQAFRLSGDAVDGYRHDGHTPFIRFDPAVFREWSAGIVDNIYPRTGRFAGIDTVVTPAGAFERCAHIITRVQYGATSYEQYELWYAPGVGLVRLAYTLFNYGNLLESYTDELVSYNF